MHLFFSGIGGAGIGPLALIAHQAGYKVSGSDKQASDYIDYLKKNGITDIHIGQDRHSIEKIHTKAPIDWYIYSSAVAIENPNSEELVYCREQSIKTTKRDDLLNYIINEKKLKLVAIAGTHGKSTTTSMVVWLLKSLSIPVSYSVGAKMNFGEMGEYADKSVYFVYEADEFDRNFLSFEPYLSVISGVSWDHHEIFPTREDYQDAFREFIDQSKHTILWSEDKEYLSLSDNSQLLVESSDNPSINKIELAGHFNRLDAWLAVKTVHKLTNSPLGDLVDIINKFPGLQRRMEELVRNLYTDYAHTPEKIRGAMSAALELSSAKDQDLVVVYEPLTDRRQHFMQSDYGDCFEGAKEVYWLPSYLAREDPNEVIITPEELISKLDDQSIAKPMKRDNTLKLAIDKHLSAGDMVVCMNGGGGNSLDEWLRRNYLKDN